MLGVHCRRSMVGGVVGSGLASWALWRPVWGEALEKRRSSFDRANQDAMAAMRMMAGAASKLNTTLEPHLQQNASLLAVGTLWRLRHPVEEDFALGGDGGWGGGMMGRPKVAPPPENAVDAISRLPVPLSAPFSKQAMQEAAHWSDVAFAVYEEDGEVVERALGGDGDGTRLVLHRSEATPLLPAFAVGLDHEEEAVVVAIRGTSSVEDALTDLGGDAVPFRGGYAHEGMARSVERLLGEDVGLGGVVQRLVEEHQGYRVVVVGHSLGGGVASLLAMELAHTLAFPLATRSKFPEFLGSQVRWGEEKVGNVRLKDVHLQFGGVQVLGKTLQPGFGMQRLPIHCYAYGPPPVADSTLCYTHAGLVTAFLNGHDVVPRLGLASLQRLYERMWSTRESWIPEMQSEIEAMEVIQHVARAKKRLDSILEKTSNAFDDISALLPSSTPPPQAETTPNRLSPSALLKTWHKTVSESIENSGWEGVDLGKLKSVVEEHTERATRDVGRSKESVDRFLKAVGVLGHEESEEDRQRQQKGVVNLHVPGLLIHIQHHNRPLTPDEPAAIPTKVQAALGNSKLLSHILLSPFLVTDHLEPAYREAFQALLQEEEE